MHVANNGNVLVNLKALLSSQGVILCKSLDAEQLRGGCCNTLHEQLRCKARAQRLRAI